MMSVNPCYCNFNWYSHKNYCLTLLHSSYIGNITFFDNFKSNSTFTDKHLPDIDGFHKIVFLQIFYVWQPFFKQKWESSTGKLQNLLLKQISNNLLKKKSHKAFSCYIKYFLFHIALCIFLPPKFTDVSYPCARKKYDVKIEI